MTSMVARAATEVTGLPPKVEMVEPWKLFGDFRRGHGDADGHAVAHALGAGDDVRDDFPVLDAEPVLAGAAEAGLHFVGDEQAAVFFDDGENDLEIFRRRSDESADALNGFGDERGDVAAGAGLNQVFDVIGAGHAAIGIFQAAAGSGSSRDSRRAQCPR